MPHNRSLILTVANGRDFIFPVLSLCALVIVAAALSPRPLLLTILVIVVFGLIWLIFTLGFLNVSKGELTSVIFPDGLVRIESDHEATIEGHLDGQQWYSPRLAVLRYHTAGKHRQLVFLSAQQNADHYRRMAVWLRQDFCNDSAHKPVSETAPASRV